MRPEKATIVSELSEALKRSPFVLVTDYRGMKVADFSELRGRLAPAGAEVHVVKNNFLKLAMADSGFPQLDDQFAGQTAVVTGEADVAPVARFLRRSRPSLSWLRSGLALSIAQCFPRRN